MIDLAVLLAMQDAGFGQYGETLWWNQSPVMQDGTVSYNEGAWVNSATVSVNGDRYTDTITITTRFGDVIKQALYLLHLMTWVNNGLINACSLSCKPLADLTFEQVQVRKATAIDFDAIDGEGRWVKSIRFDVSYKLPKTLPSFE